jgi:hypothetical protein
MSKTNRVCSTRSDGYWKSCGSCCANGRRRQGSREVLGARAIGYCKAGKRRVEGVERSSGGEVTVCIKKGRHSLEDLSSD